MKVTTEKLDNNLAKIIVEVDNADFLKECTNVYNKNKSKYNVPGFRKGHVDQKTVEKVYGAGVFFEEACDNCINKTYYDAVNESKLDVISRPKISVSKIGKDDNLVYEATVAVTPDFKVDNYKGIELKKEKVEATEEEINERLKKEQEKNGEIETKDGDIKNGDIAVIDFEGFVDDKAFQGGKGTDYSLNIGSHSFVDTFEDQLIGHKAGDDVEVKVHFPKEYHASLADKDAVFKVKVKEVKEKHLPELNDEFASMVSEFETLNDLKENFKKKIEEEKSENNNRKLENEAINKIVENTKIDLPREAIDTEIDLMIENIEQQLKRQGITLDKYLSMLNKSLDEYRKTCEVEATKNLKTRLILDKIAKKDDVKASDEMVEDDLKNMAMQYGMNFDDIKDKISNEEKDRVRNELKYKAVVKYIIDNAKVK